MKLKFTLVLLFVTNLLFAQDSIFVRKMVNTLTSPVFWGRGYTKDGVHKAAAFLSAQFKIYGLKPMNGNNFSQDFTYNINTYPGKMEVTINGIALRPGSDFIIRPDSRGVKGEGKLQQDSADYVDVPDKVIVIPEDKLTWSAEQNDVPYTVVEVDKKALKDPPATIKIDVESQLVKDFKTANICGIVKGTLHPDSLIVYTAHYDHLGGMGACTYFPGANDNASGVTQVLSLAQYYAAHPQPYTMAFILFSGEEAGLLGSKYFTEHPLVPLSSIRFLVNLDLEGTGVDGVTVVNATVYPKEFARLQQLNQAGHYLVKVNLRGKAANSDHYLFSDKGVPAFFIYTLGGIKAYHDVYDISKTLPLDHLGDEFKLLLKFNEYLMNGR